MRAGARARLDPDDPMLILCGHPYDKGFYCDEPLSKILMMPGGVRHAYFGQEWDDRQRSDGVIVKTGLRREKRGYSPTRRGHLTSAGQRQRTARSFPFPIDVLCPRCRWINYFDPDVLDIQQVPYNR